MGQMFFNIGQLADFLIADKAIPQNLPSASPAVKFDDYIKSLTAKASGQAEYTDAAKAGLPDFENTITQSGAAASISAADPASPNLFGTLTANASAKGPDQLIALLGGFSARPAEGGNVPVAKPANDIVETFAQSSLQTIQIKDLIMAQAVPVKIELDKVNVKPGDLAFQNSESKARDAFSGIDPGQYYNGIVKQNEPLVSAIDPNIQLDRPVQPVNLRAVYFTADQLFNQDNSKIQIVAYDDRGKQYDLDLEPENLQRLINNYQGKLLVEAKSLPQLDMSNLRIDLLSAKNSGPDKAEKSVIFDLKSLLKAKDVESVSVVNKTVIASAHNDTRAVAENPNFNYLISQSLTRKQSIRPLGDMPEIKTSNLENSFANQAEFVKSTEQNNQAVRHNSESSDNGKDTKAASKDNANTQTSDVRTPANTGQSSTMEKPIAGQASTRLAGGEEISAIQHADLKAPAAIDSRNSEMMFIRTGGEGNIDMVESLVEQLKSQLTSNSHGTRMIIDLKPESLGKIRIDFKYHGDKVEALFKVDHSDIKMLLDSELNKLKNDFRIDSYKVEVNSQPSHNSDTYQQKNPHFAGNRGWHQGSPGTSNYEFDYEENPESPISHEPIKKATNRMVDLFA